MDPYDPDSDAFCHCSQRHIPTDDDFYDLWDNMVLGDLGEGFPLLFQLMKYINWLLFWLCIIYFIPTASIINNTINKLGDNVKNDEKLSMFSFGAMLKCVEPERIVDFPERSDFINNYCVVMFIAVAATMIMITCIRVYLTKDINTIDALSYTPSDFAVIGDCPAFSVDNDYSLEAITKEVEEYLAEYVPDASGVEYVNVAYDIEDIFELLSKERELLKLREQIEWFCKKHEWTEQDYDAKTSNYDLFKDFPMKPDSGGICSSEEPLVISELDAEIKDIQAQIEEQEKVAGGEGEEAGDDLKE